MPSKTHSSTAQIPLHDRFVRRSRNATYIMGFETKKKVCPTPIFSILARCLKLFRAPNKIMLRTIFRRPEIRLATDFCDVAQTLYKSWFGLKFDLLRRLHGTKMSILPRTCAKSRLPRTEPRISGGDFLHTSLVILTCWFLAPYGGGDFLHTSLVILTFWSRGSVSRGRICAQTIIFTTFERRR